MIYARLNTGYTCTIAPWSPPKRSHSICTRAYISQSTTLKNVIEFNWLAINWKTFFSSNCLFRRQMNLRFLMAHLITCPRPVAIATKIPATTIGLRQEYLNIFFLLLLITKIYELIKSKRKARYLFFKMASIFCK